MQLELITPIIVYKIAKLMRKFIFIISTINCFSQIETVSVSKRATQNDSIKDVYLYIDSRNFFGSKGEYKTSFSIKSKDPRFSHDNFNFYILDNQLEERNIYSIGKYINKDLLDYVNPNDYFENKSILEIHDELSLLSIKNNKRIFIITYVQRKQIYMVWEAKYAGTIRDVTYTQLGKGPFYTEK